MKSFLIGIGMFGMIMAVVYTLSILFSVLGFSSDTIRTLFVVGMLLFVAKPFGELTESVFKRIR